MNQKKTMKTKSENTKSGLKNRSEQVSTDNSSKAERKDNRLPIDRAARCRNRRLKTDGVLNMMVGTVPEVYRLAEVVGKWVWIQFAEAPAAEIRQKLSQIGFHWNRHRQSWQHPCGLTRFAILRSHGQTMGDAPCTRLPVALYVRNDHRKPRLVKLIATCGPLDLDGPQPAITVMLPDED
jgi:hypothetical protein